MAKDELNGVPIPWDALTRDITRFEPEELLREWRWLLGQRFTLRAITIFGDLFLEDGDGSVHNLDAGTGEFERVASTFEEFEALRAEPENLTAWFYWEMALRLYRLHGALEPDQCWGYKMPPGLGGSVTDEANYEPTTLMIHHGILGQIARQIVALPPGTPIKSVEIAFPSGPPGDAFSEIWPGLTMVEAKRRYRYEPLSIDFFIGDGVPEHLVRYGLFGTGNALVAGEIGLDFAEGTAEVSLELDEAGRTLLVAGRDYVGPVAEGRRGEPVLWYRLDEGVLRR